MNKIRIPANRMDTGFLMHQEEYEAKALEVLRSGWYILGHEVEEFEKNFAAYTGMKYCAGVGNGLDALTLGMRALGIGEGDEVLVQANTYIASVMGITLNGAKPVFVEPDEYYQMDVSRIEEAITPRTKAILIVHLYGHITDMDRVAEICKEHRLRLVEDCAQAHGALWNGKPAGSFGDVGCFSFYPSKNIGAFGDAGAVVSNDENLIRHIKTLRNYGSQKRYHNREVGVNSRLDELQAGLLNVRLKYAQEITDERYRIAGRYSQGIHNPKLILPKERPGCKAVWHQYVVRTEQRDRLVEYLSDKGIGSIIHYPIPPHLSEAYRYLGHKEGSYPITERYADTVLSVPMYTGMTEEIQQEVIDALNQF